jgi:protein required for attachment to host cells
MDKLRLKHGLWVVVADGEKALFLENIGDATYPNLRVVREMENDNPAARDQGTDRPGRFNDGPSVHRSAVEETDWHRMAHRGDFKEIVLVAPPLVLGEMRKKLHKEVGDRVVAEIAKTLTNHPIDEVEALLKAA